MSYRIASYNAGGPIPLILTDAAAVANVVKQNRLDVVALQDMQGNAATIVDAFCKVMCDNLNQYEFCSGRGREADRSFAFVWNTNTVTLIEEPIIYDRYRTDTEWAFKRDPLVGRFLTGNGYEIRLINTHLFFSNERQRKSECARITGDVYYGVASIVPENIGTKVFTFALGDYNLSCKDCNQISSENQFFDIVTAQEDYTTLKSSGNKDDGYTSSGMTNNSYDHFTYDKYKVESALRDKPTAIDVPREQFGGNYTEYFNTMSDHIPVVIEIF